MAGVGGAGMVIKGQRAGEPCGGCFCTLTANTRAHTVIKRHRTHVLDQGQPPGSDAALGLYQVHPLGDTVSAASYESITISK